MAQAQKNIRATQLKNNLGQYLGEVIHSQRPVFVEKHGQPVAVLVGMQQWKELTGEALPERSAWVEACRDLSRQIRKRGVKPKKSAVALIRELRQQS